MIINIWWLAFTLALEQHILVLMKLIYDAMVPFSRFINARLWTGRAFFFFQHSFSFTSATVRERKRAMFCTENCSIMKWGAFREDHFKMLIYRHPNYLNIFCACVNLDGKSHFFYFLVIQLWYSNKQTHFF